MPAVDAALILTAVSLALLIVLPSLEHAGLKSRRAPRAVRAEVFQLPFPVRLSSGQRAADGEQRWPVPAR